MEYIFLFALRHEKTRFTYKSWESWIAFQRFTCDPCHFIFQSSVYASGLVGDFLTVYKILYQTVLSLYEQVSQFSYAQGSKLWLKLFHLRISRCKLTVVTGTLFRPRSNPITVNRKFIKVHYLCEIQESTRKDSTLIRWKRNYHWLWSRTIH